MRGFLSVIGVVFFGSVSSTSAMGLTGVLGDSLSDPCNLYNLDPAAVPNPPYPDRQFTNGNTWATQLGSGCGVGLNYAYGGATALDNSDNLIVGSKPFDPDVSAITPEPPAIPDLQQQADMYITDAPDVDYTAVWIGANDLFRTLENNSDPVGLLLLDAKLAETVDTVVAKVEEVIREIALLNPPNEQFVLFGLPELGKTPLITSIEIPLLPPNFITSRMNNATLDLNSKYEALVKKLHPEIPIVYYDINKFYLDIINNPIENGFINVTDSCYDFDTMEPCVLADGYLFWDLVHPTQRVHGIILKEYESLISDSLPVPLPAGLPLLLGALGGLALVSKRHKMAIQ